jgi:hypothetical protein
MNTYIENTSYENYHDELYGFIQSEFYSLFNKKDFVFDVDAFINKPFCTPLYMERYNGTFYSKHLNSSRVVYFVEEIVNRKNCYVYNDNYKYYEENGLELKLNESQPSNTIFIGNVPIEEIMDYYCGGNKSYLINHESIIVGKYAYDIYGNLLSHSLPVFVDIEVVKNNLDKNNQIMNTAIQTKEFILDFDKIFKMIC